MTSTKTRMLEVRAGRIDFDIKIRAPRSRVWQALLEDVDAWWVADMRCVANSRVRLEARAGGSLVEEAPNGDSLLWFHVLARQHEESLNLAGSLAPPFGGPADVYLHLALADDAEGTRLSVCHSTHGHTSEESITQSEEGWRMIFEGGLKAHVEKG